MPRLIDSPRWRKRRYTYLGVNPWCVMCLLRGMYTEAKVVDHRKPHRGDPTLFWDENNWQSLCENHHNSAKQSMEKSGRDYMSDVGVDGLPIDPNHPWNK